MKPVGIVRQIDALGRIVIPKELRRTLDISEGDSLELFIEDNTVILRKYQPACMICGSAKSIVTYKGRNFCPDCVREIATKLL
ncbi:MAG: AbrB/MazE/SpoVT family DNA-binding domain-containing protein [Clostridia bacterium]|nr:AbrB/MazE/SpoVT family DNA-binding domain-containing protein [Clostridia bacterium]